MIDEDQRTYVQWAEEKLSLANIAADLLIQHRTAVDKDVGALLAELKVRQLSRCTVTGALCGPFLPAHLKVTTTEASREHALCCEAAQEPSMLLRQT